MSSIGAIPFKMDDWGVDIAITGSQKALCMPTGLGLTCVSPKALEATKTAKLPRVFFSYADMGELPDSKSSLGDAESLLSDAKSSLGDAKSSLGDGKRSMGDGKSSLGDGKSSLGDAKSFAG